MIVISDTTPIISLLKIRRLDILKMLFHRIIIPNAVYKELTDNHQFQEEALRSIQELRMDNRHIGENIFQYAVKMIENK